MARDRDQDVCSVLLGTFSRQGASGTVRAIAQAKAAISRAMATTTWLTCFPRAVSWRYRLQRRTCALPPPLSGRVLRGREAEVAHQLARSVEPREIPEFGDHDDGTGELDPAQRLDRLDHRGQPPARHLLVQLGLQALQSLVLLGDGAHVLLENDLLRPGRTHHLGQPAEMRGIPVGPTLVANVLPQQERLEPVLGR